MILSAYHCETLGAGEKPELSYKGKMNPDQESIISKHEEKVSSLLPKGNLQFDLTFLPLL